MPNQVKEQQQTQALPLPLLLMPPLLKKNHKQQKPQIVFVWSFFTPFFILVNGLGEKKKAWSENKNFFFWLYRFVW